MDRLPLHSLVALSTTATLTGLWPQRRGVRVSLLVATVSRPIGGEINHGCSVTCG